ncbi:MAG: purine-nucleoside phosphorylase [Saprospiraceae bacterium]|nr:purine-nucleoside phosphorylase [Saprospiraceae bacterium]
MTARHPFETYQEAAAFIEAQIDFSPSIGVITGTGLSLSSLLTETHKVLSYEEIPNFPLPTAPSHRGKLILGSVGDTKMAIFQGRLHVYEGLVPEQVTFPVRLLQQMNVPKLIVLNASGSVSPRFVAGDIMLIEDHINFMQENPLIGPNDDRLGPRFPDMSQVYNRKLRAEALRAAEDLGLKLGEGIYLALKGPSLETRAEYRMVQKLGADVVGMSTVPEAIVASHAGIDVLGISVVSNHVDFEKDLEPTTIEEVVEKVGAAEADLCALLQKVLHT